MARTHNKHFITYEPAKQIVQEANLQTRDQFWAWHKENDILYMPRFPNAHYKKDWIGWNDFLGNDNVFDKELPFKRKQKTLNYRNYWDAVRFSQAIAAKENITNAQEWLDKYNDLNLPEDIPRRPEQVPHYTEFSWKVWLGKDIQSKVETGKNEVAIICFHRVIGEPANVLQMKVWKDGFHSMVGVIDNSDLLLPCSKCSWMIEDGAIQFAEGVLMKSGTKNGDQWIIRDINQLLWDMMDLELYITK